MSRRIMTTLLALLPLLCALAQSDEQASVADLVNPLTGTQSTYTLSAGNTYPAIAMPWGMNFWTPQTGKMGDGWQYTYTSTKMRGLKQTHQPSPWINDYGQFSVLPETGVLVFDEDKRASWFSHQAETALPYYYKVYLADYDVWAEIAPTERAAMMRFTYPEATGGHAHVLIDAFDQGSSIKADPATRTISGYSTRNAGGVPENFRNYFVIKSDKPFSTVTILEDGTVVEGANSATGGHVMAAVSFDTSRGEEVCLRIASSFISPEQAMTNLGELGDEDFDTVKERGRKRWNEVLGRVEVKDSDTDHLRTFYSCLYRSTLFPRMFYEYDTNGEAIHYSPYNGKVCKGYLFADTGFWDTFRSLFPLVNLLYPSMGVRILEGLANAYDESGFLPEWCSPGHRDCMVGNNSAAVVADGLSHHIKTGKISPSTCETLWQAVTHGANSVHPEVKSTGRLGYEYYNRIGYVPSDAGISESAARTLEYSYDDWCIYQTGRMLGKPDDEIKAYALRAMNYKNLYNPRHKLMQGRKSGGDWAEPFNPLKWGGDFTEGNSWHYTWSVFHDPAGLIDLMGGDEVFVSMLDSVFRLPPAYDASYYGSVIHEIREMQVSGMGNYAHGNQPIQHMIYLYDYANEPSKAQYHIREVMDRLYTATPNGYCGDEDNGQTSAWYVFGALGFYSVCPGSGQYALGAPYFERTVIHLENGNDVTVTANGVNSQNRYVGSMTLNGQPYTHSYITCDDLLRGADITCHMTRTMPVRAMSQEDKPYSYKSEYLQKTR